MTERFANRALFTLVALLLTVRPAAAVEDVLRLVPQSASGVVIVNNPTALDAKIQAAGSYVEVPVPSALMLLKLQAGIREGVDEKGSFALVVMPPKTEEELPTPILLIPVADYVKFIEQMKPENTRGDTTKIEVFGSPAWAKKIGGYVAMTDGNSRDVLEKLKVAKELRAELKSWQKWIAENDVAGVVFQPGVKRLSAKAQQSILMMKGMIAQTGDKKTASAGAVFDVYATLLQTAEKEVSAIGVCLQLDKQNAIILTNRAALVPGGNWASLASKFQPMKENLLNGLPDKPFIAAGAVALPPAIWEEMMKFSTDMMKNMSGVYGMTPEQIDAFAKMSMHSVKSISAMSGVVGVSETSESVYANTIGIFHVDDADAFMAGYEKDAKKSAELLKEINNTMLPTPEIEKGEIGGKPAIKITTGIPRPEGADGAAADRAAEIMLGPDKKLTAWIAPIDKHRIAAGYLNKEKMGKAIESIQKGKPEIAGDADLLKTAALLPSGAVASGYASPAGFIQFVQRMAMLTLPPGTDIEQNLPKFPKTPPIGFAVNVKPNEARKCVVVPPETFKAIVQYIMELRAKHAGAAIPR